jgi:hypothetical protein
LKPHTSQNNAPTKCKWNELEIHCSIRLIIGGKFAGTRAWIEATLHFSALGLDSFSPPLPKANVPFSSQLGQNVTTPERTYAGQQRRKLLAYCE